jgi:hypothetical protein
MPLRSLPIYQLVHLPRARAPLFLTLTAAEQPAKRRTYACLTTSGASLTHPSPMSTLSPATVTCSENNAIHFWFTSAILIIICVAWAAYVFIFHTWRMLSDPDEYEREYDRWWKKVQREIEYHSARAQKDVLLAKIIDADAEFKRAEAAKLEGDREDEREEEKQRKAEREETERDKIRRGQQSVATGSQSSDSQIT